MSTFGAVPMPSSTQTKPKQATKLSDFDPSAVPINAPTVKRLTLKKAMYHPLTWIAIGLHLGLLWVPFQTRPSAEPEATEPVSNDSMPVDILNLSDIATSMPPPPKSEVMPPPPSAVPSPPPPSAPAAASTQTPQPPVAEATIPDANPAAEPAADNSTPAGTPNDPGEQPLPQPAYDASQDQGVFIQNLGMFGADDTTEKTGLPPADSKNYFRKGNGQFFVSPTGEAADGAKDARWMNQKPEQVLNTLATSYQGALNFGEAGTYGDEPLYQATTAAGETAMFISLVDMKASTLLVIWPTDPNGG